MKYSIHSLASEIDLAIDDQDITKLEAFSTLCANVIEDIPPSITFFFEANCHSALSTLRNIEPHDRLDWQQNERVSETLALRRAISHSSFSEIDDIWKCKIFTNLGNNLNFLGRICEAMRQWDGALNILPNFAMAHGNKGQGLWGYAGCLYDCGHSNILAHEATKSFKQTLQNPLWDSGEQPELRHTFHTSMNSIEKYLQDIDFDEQFNLNQWSLGETEDEINYRKWSLSNGLFLSPLNDILNLSVAAQDVIHLPSHTYDFSEKPRFPNYFNILKQEYVTARFMLYESEIYLNKKHFSDKDVLLMNGLDYANFGYGYEQLKTSFRLSYSIFDKIALFLNDYFKIELKTSSVNFKSIWGKQMKKKFELYPTFANSQNWPLRGLYYISKDFFDERFLDVSLPDAKELSSIRNKLEHRFLSVNEFPYSHENNSEIHSHIEINDFRKKTLRLLRNAREALIYLSLAMHREERLRAQQKEVGTFAVPIQGIPIKRN